MGDVFNRLSNPTIDIHLVSMHQAIKDPLYKNLLAMPINPLAPPPDPPISDFMYICKAICAADCTALSLEAPLCTLPLLLCWSNNLEA